MNELKKPNQPHSRYLKVGIWVVLSALILTGLAIIVGVAFEEIGGEQASIEEVVYLPQQHDYSRGTSTLSYSMAARYSDGSIGSLPNVLSLEALGDNDTDDRDESRTQGDPDSADIAITLTESAGAGQFRGAGSRAEPIVYNFSNCGASQYTG
ncbi:MAG: hypothetical protein QGH39_07295, partial [Candidatus Thermoplasmatota archaeon]|nr:hypothetical protein [Candidatus Thermoplasmatota archaeon]